MECYDTVITQKYAWVMNLSGSSKMGRVGIFSRVVIFLSKIRPPKMQSVYSGGLRQALDMDKHC